MIQFGSVQFDYSHVPPSNNSVMLCLVQLFSSAQFSLIIFMIYQGISSFSSMKFNYPVQFNSV